MVEQEEQVVMSHQGDHPAGHLLEAHLEAQGFTGPAPGGLAAAHRNRTYLPGVTGHIGFEVRGGHQPCNRCRVVP